MSFSENADFFAQKKPAAWVWKITGTGRVVYLVGEMHVFTDVNEGDLEFKLGFDVYKNSSKIFTEAESVVPSLYFHGDELSDVVGSDLWAEIDHVISSVLDKTRYSTEEKLALKNKELKEINSQSAGMAYLKLSGLSYFSYIGSHSFLDKKLSIVPGLSLRIFKIEDKLKETGKINYLEENYAVDNAWYQKCNTSTLAKNYLISGLSFFNFNNFWGSNKRTSTQDVFFKNNSSLNDIFNVWMRDYPGSDITLQCNLIPRNLAWMPKILALLNEHGDAVAIYVGIAHLVGDDGLISKLRGNGDYKIERIFNFQ